MKAKIKTLRTTKICAASIPSANSNNGANLSTGFPGKMELKQLENRNP